MASAVGCGPMAAMTLPEDSRRQPIKADGCWRRRSQVADGYLLVDGGQWRQQRQQQPSNAAIFKGGVFEGGSS